MASQRDHILKGPPICNSFPFGNHKTRDALENIPIRNFH